MGDDYGIFEDSAVREFESPERIQRHRSHVRQAYQTVHAAVGPFLDNATSDDELVSRVALVQHDIDTLLLPFQLTAQDHEAIVQHLAKPDPGGPAAVAGDFTTKPAQSPGIDVPWDAEDTPVQEASEDKNDATLEHISKKKTVTANGSHWAWDSDANCFKSSNTSTFGCSCGRQAFSGVGQHRCVCGKVWNISSIANGAKQATDAPSYACREVHTDDRLMLAGIQHQAMSARCDVCNKFIHSTSKSPVGQGGVAGWQHDNPEDDDNHRAEYKPGTLKGASDNGDGNDSAKGGSGDSEDDAPQPELVMHPDDPSYVDPTQKTTTLMRHLYADTGLWPMVSDKDLQANWKTLMGIVTDPTQVSVLEHGGYQDLIAELYQEIGRRGLSTPQPDQNSSMPQPQMQQPQQMGMQPQQQMPSPSALASRQGLAEWVIAANKRLSVEDEYANRSTVFDGSEPPIPGLPIAIDDLNEGPEDNDPTATQRSDFASDTDRRNTVGESDKEMGNHPEDFKPETETHT